MKRILVLIKMLDQRTRIIFKGLSSSGILKENLCSASPKEMLVQRKHPFKVISPKEVLTKENLCPKESSERSIRGGLN